MLSEALLESQPKDAPFAIVEGRPLGRKPRLHRLIARLVPSQRLHHRHGFPIIAVAWDIDREGPPGLLGLQRLPDVLLGELQALRDLADGGAAPQLIAQLRDGLLDSHGAFLERAWQAKLPNAIAEVTAELTENRRCGVGGERLAALGVEAIQRLDQAEACDLHQVVEGLGAPAVAQSQRACQRQQAPDQFLPQRRVAGLRVRAQEIGLAGADGWVGREGDRLNRLIDIADEEGPSLTADRR